MNNQSFYERRLQTHKLVHELLEKRKQILALLDQLVKLQPYSPEQRLEPLVRDFCQELIDYISLEHFGIFHHLVNGRENRQPALALAEIILPQMIDTTNIILDFNDRVEVLPSASLSFELPGELLVLGDALAVRAELEDRLMKGMIS